jgi:alpha-beta hydrolase superfamily lysophospholipase
MTVTPLWFGPSERPLFGWLHVPVGGQARGAVVLCPPVGRDYLQAHYALRRLAERAQQCGLCVLRFDYDGTGDSAGTGTDQGRVEAWLESTCSALAVVRATGASRVALVGMRLGAAVAATAAARDGAVDQLVLWDPCPSGRMFLSEQRALASLWLGVTPTRRDGSVEIPGLVLGAETVRHVEKLRIDDSAGRLADHVLVLTRSGTQDGALHKGLVSTDAEWGEATGQVQLMDAVSPQYQLLPDAMIERIAAWLSCHADGAPLTVSTPPAAGPVTLGATDTGGAVTERPVFLGPLGLFGLVTEPAGRPVGPTVVFLSVAKEHHVGPNRLWVDLARRLARGGRRSVRVDLSGLGDSPVRAGQPEFVSRTPMAFDDVVDVARAVSPDDPANIVLVGLCSAAYQALESALELRPRCVVAINPILSFEPPEVLAGAPLDPRRRIAMPRGALLQALDHHGPLSPLNRRFPSLAWRLRILVAPGRRSGLWLKELTASGVDLLLVCGEHEAVPILRGASAQTLEALAGTGCFRFELVAGLDHGLLRSDHRDRVSEMLVTHVLERFGHDGESTTGARVPPLVR